MKHSDAHHSRCITLLASPFPSHSAFHSPLAIYTWASHTFQLHAHMRSPRSVQLSWVKLMLICICVLRLVLMAYILKPLALSISPPLPAFVLSLWMAMANASQNFIFMKCNFQTINQRTSTWHFNSLIDHKLGTSFRFSLNSMQISSK